MYTGKSNREDQDDGNGNGNNGNRIIVVLIFKEAIEWFRESLYS